MTQVSFEVEAPSKNCVTAAPFRHSFDAPFLNHSPILLQPLNLSAHAGARRLEAEL